MHPRRKLTATDVLTVRQDKALRENAFRMRKLATEILRTVPTVTAHARRLGVHHRTLHHIAQGVRYKEVRP